MAILQWEQGEHEINDLRLRAVFHGLKSYMEQYKLAYSLRRALPTVQGTFMRLRDSRIIIR